jgi:hypothetical protein
MRHAGGIRRRRAKSNGIEIFTIVTVKVNDLCSGFFMFNNICGYPYFRDFFDPENMETMDSITHGEGSSRTGC